MPFYRSFFIAVLASKQKFLNMFSRFGVSYGCSHIRKLCIGAYLSQCLIAVSYRNGEVMTGEAIRLNPSINRVDSS